MSSVPFPEAEVASPFDVVCAGLGFPEGPIAMRDGSIILVEIEYGLVSRILPDGARTVIADVGGGPNGAAIGPDGALYICNNGGMAFAKIGDMNVPHGAKPDHAGGYLQRLDLRTGGVEVLHRTAGGQPLIGPNDLVFDGHGGFWFTDHGNKSDDGMRFGALCYAPVGNCEPIRVRDGLMSPNGVGMSPDGATLHVSDTWTGRLLSFEITGPGTVAEPPPFQPASVTRTLPNYQLLDSLAVEAGGRVCVGTLVNGGISVFDVDGPTDAEVEHVALRDMIVTNICFGGDDMRDAWITCSGTGRLMRTRWPRPGLRLAFAA